MSNERDPSELQQTRDSIITIVKLFIGSPQGKIAVAFGLAGASIIVGSQWQAIFSAIWYQNFGVPVYFEQTPTEWSLYAALIALVFVSHKSYSDYKIASASNRAANAATARTVIVRRSLRGFATIASIFITIILAFGIYHFWSTRHEAQTAYLSELDREISARLAVLLKGVQPFQKCADAERVREVLSNRDSITEAKFSGRTLDDLIGRAENLYSDSDEAQEFYARLLRPVISQIQTLSYSCLFVQGSDGNTDVKEADFVRMMRAREMLSERINILSSAYQIGDWSKVFPMRKF